MDKSQTSSKNKIIRQMLDGWRYTLSNRYELLESLKDECLDFTPPGNHKLGDLQSQFATIGGTYQAYTKLLKEKRFRSEPFAILESRLTKFRKMKSLEIELKKIDKEFEMEVLKHTDDEEFDWGKIKTPIWRAISIAQEMERLCHGQLICYFALAGYKLPPNFKRDWGLSYLEE